MIKTVICIRRKANLTHKEFLDYGLNKHGKLVQQLRQDLGIVRYVQNHSRQHPLSDRLQYSRQAPEMFDGVGEAWFESIDSLVSQLEQSRARSALDRLYQDELNFSDSSEGQSIQLY